MNMPPPPPPPPLIESGYANVGDNEGKARETRWSMDTGVEFCGASQPRPFLSKGIFVRMVKAEDGLLNQRQTFFRHERFNKYIEQLEAIGEKTLSRIFDGIFTQHQSRVARIYELSVTAKVVYNEYCSQVVREQNARFQGTGAYTTGINYR